MELTIELFGMARHRAGTAALAVDAVTLLDALRQVDARCPKLAILQADGTLSPHYLLSLNGEHFVGDLSKTLPPHARLLLLSADVGG